MAKRVPQEWEQHRTVEQEIYEAMKVVCLERVAERIEENGEVTQSMPQVRVSEHILEQSIDVPVPQTWEQIVEGVKASTQERVQQRTVRRDVQQQQGKRQQSSRKQQNTWQRKETRQRQDTKQLQ